VKALGLALVSRAGSFCLLGMAEVENTRWAGAGGGIGRPLEWKVKARPRSTVVLAGLPARAMGRVELCMAGIWRRGLDVLV
jgi:hypothetical protein